MRAIKGQASVEILVIISLLSLIFLLMTNHGIQMKNEVQQTRNLITFEKKCIVLSEIITSLMNAQENTSLITVMTGHTDIYPNGESKIGDEECNVPGGVFNATYTLLEGSHAKFQKSNDKIIISVLNAGQEDIGLGDGIERGYHEI